MRHVLLATATCLSLISAPAITASAADEPAHPKAEAGKEAAKAGKAVNKLDPLTGKEVDASVDTLELSYTHKKEKKTVVVGFSSKDSFEEAKKADEKKQELIAQAAEKHKLIKEGKLVEPEGHKHDHDHDHKDK
jgi:hypothetical protein